MNANIVERTSGNASTQMKTDRSRASARSVPLNTLIMLPPSNRMGRAG